MVRISCSFWKTPLLTGYLNFNIPMYFSQSEPTNCSLISWLSWLKALRTFLYLGSPIKLGNTVFGASCPLIPAFTSALPYCFVLLYQFLRYQ